MKKVLMITGSLREKSFNRQLAVKASQLLAGKAEVSFLEYDSIPFMNQDIEFPTPQEIERVRSEVSNSDGIWFFTPEYNSSYPGLLKNLLDWLSRPVRPGGTRSETAVYGKKAAISGAAGKSAASCSRAKLTELLKFMSLELLEQQVGISVSPESFQTNVLTLSKENEEALRKQAEAFLEFLNQ